MFPGITRGLIISLCIENNIPLIEKNISVTELYNADQVFTTGTMGELAQVIEIDKRQIKNKGEILDHLKKLFEKNKIIRWKNNLILFLQIIHH